MREIVPAAIGSARTVAAHGGKDVKIVTVLPGGFVALHRPDGEVLLSVQDTMASDDLSRDLAAALLQALDAEPGTPIASIAAAPGSPRLQDVLDLSASFTPEITNDYDFWIDSGAERTAELESSLAEAAEASTPTEAVPGVEWAYWCEMGKPFMRWIRPEDEDDLIKAMARLAAKRELALELADGGEGRFLGMFRAAGLVVPVWELPDGTVASDLTVPVQALDKRLAAALAVSGPLDAVERRAREGIVSRQITLR
jgi:hypothetical protein